VSQLVLPERKITGRFVEITTTWKSHGQTYDSTFLARLLEREAPATCAAVRMALENGPLVAEGYHAKYARNEIYGMYDRFTQDLGRGPDLENPSITPALGQVMAFDFTLAQLGTPSYGYQQGSAALASGGATDLAVFYGHNNYLFNGDAGTVFGTVFAEIIFGPDGYGGQAELHAAGTGIWRHGEDSRLTFGCYKS
jgi:hypothetical protein